MVGTQGYIAKNLKTVAETGKSAFSGKVVTLLAPVIALFAKKKQRLEYWRCRMEWGPMTHDR